MNAYFLLEWIEFRFKLPYRIMPGITLRKCKTVEEERIKTFFEEQASQYLGGYKYYLKKGSTTNSLQNEDRDKWRYWLLDYDSDLVIYDLLKYSMNLLEFELNIGMIVVSSPKGVITLWHEQPKLYNYFNDSKNIFLTKLQKKDFEQLKHFYKQIESLDKIEYSNILQALASFEDTKLLSKNIKFKVLAYFTIIEGLLTHNPKDPTNVDSITRQITNKINLLNNRISEKIDIPEWFGEITTKNLFGKLYSYRSAIAHGLTIDYNGEFQIFRDYTYAHDFIKDMTKKILRFSISEPKLINDLKLC